MDPRGNLITVGIQRPAPIYAPGGARTAVTQPAAVQPVYRNVNSSGNQSGGHSGKSIYEQLRISYDSCAAVFGKASSLGHHLCFLWSLKTLKQTKLLLFWYYKFYFNIFYRWLLSIFLWMACKTQCSTLKPNRKYFVSFESNHGRNQISIMFS